MESKSLFINLSENSYHLHVGREIIQQHLLEALSSYQEKEIFIITNTTIQGLYPQYIKNMLADQLTCHECILEDGEQYKTLDTVSSIYDFLMKNKASRKSILIAFGGGVIGDIVGFVASTFKRGIPYIQIPTTLLSQVDSSVGGKTGVNHRAGKNCIGAFKQPLVTIIDSHLLNTLNEREFRAGYAELIKHAFIRDRNLFDRLEKTNVRELQKNHQLLQECIYESCKVKASVVEQDEKESSIRAILNFGHTLAHFLETFTNYEEYLHGECVIAGIEFAAWWSNQKGLLPKEDFDLIVEHLRKTNLRLEIQTVSRDEFIAILGNDKRTSSSGMVFIALEKIGLVQLISGISIQSLWDDFSEYIRLERATLAIKAT